ncbi:MAG: hypothetical protein ACK4LQ_09725 [Pararhodobacter sp.]
MTSAEPITGEQCFKLLDLLSREELSLVDQHQRRVQFFVVLLSTLVGVTLAGLINADEPSAIIPLGFVPVIVIMVAHFGRAGTFRLYQRLVETIAMRAKIEQLLGMTAASNVLPGDAYWREEPLVMSRHLADRKRFTSSEAFVANAKQHGYHSVVGKLLTAFQILAVLLLIAVAARAHAYWEVSGTIS